ncbi:hypothetical protein GJ496_009407 [Pomphorhynchus laevis]|nr:hypothetical protein GJ496_009407 [Pomphorhynchus laevis]
MDSDEEEIIIDKSKWDEEDEENVLDNWEDVLDVEDSTKQNLKPSKGQRGTDKSKKSQKSKSEVQSPSVLVDPIILQERQDCMQELNKFRQAQAMFNLTDFSIESKMNDLKTVNDYDNTAFFLAGTLSAATKDSKHFYPFVEKLACHLCSSLSHVAVKKLSNQLSDLAKKKVAISQNKHASKTKEIAIESVADSNFADLDVDSKEEIKGISHTQNYEDLDDFM